MGKEQFFSYLGLSLCGMGKKSTWTVLAKQLAHVHMDPGHGIRSGKGIRILIVATAVEPAPSYTLFAPPLLPSFSPCPPLFYPSPPPPAFPADLPALAGDRRTKEVGGKPSC